MNELLKNKFSLDNEYFVMVLIGLGVVLICLILMFILLRKGKKHEIRGKNKKGRRKQEEGKTITSIGMSLEIANLQHQGKREYQEDSFGISDIQNEKKGILAILADGMGGMAGGDAASSMAVSTIMEDFNSLEEIENPAELLLQLAEDANKKVSGIPELQVNDGGTTLILCYINSYNLYYLSVGDSRICLIRDDKIIQLNKEHTLGASLDEMVRRGEMEYEEAMNNPMRKMLTSFIGSDEIPKIDYSKEVIPILPTDKIILMSDGIFGTISDEEIVEILDNSDLNISARLMEHRVLAKNKKHQDNFTAILIKKN